VRWGLNGQGFGIGRGGRLSHDEVSKWIGDKKNCRGFTRKPVRKSRRYWSCRKAVALQYRASERNCKSI
jgi:hypothetical protein